MVQELFGEISDARREAGEKISMACKWKSLSFPEISRIGINDAKMVNVAP